MVQACLTPPPHTGQACLTPRTQRAEVMVVGRGPEIDGRDFSDAVFIAFAALTRHHAPPRCRSFSVVIYPPAVDTATATPTTDATTAPAGANPDPDRAAPAAADAGTAASPSLLEPWDAPDEPAPWLQRHCVARVWDRGPLDSRTADMGALEIQGTVTCEADPFQTVGAIQRAQRELIAQRGGGEQEGDAEAAK